MELNIKRRTNNGGRWFYVKNALLDKFQFRGTQKPYLIAVYCSLALHADRTQLSYPSQERIAQETGMSVRMVKTLIKVLSDRRLIVVERQRLKGKTRNRYILTDIPEWLMHAPPALRSGHVMPPNKTQENKKIINKKENSRSFQEERAMLRAKLSLQNSRSP